MRSTLDLDATLDALDLPPPWARSVTTSIFGHFIVGGMRLGRAEEPIDRDFLAVEAGFGRFVASSSSLVQAALGARPLGARLRPEGLAADRTGFG